MNENGNMEDDLALALKMEKRSRSRSPIKDRERERDRERDRDRDKDRERDRDRSARRNRDRDRGKSSGSDRDRSRAPSDCRVYVANIPYDMKWQDLKDMFREKVGEVAFVELFEDHDGKPRGCGIVEFKEPNLVQKAIDELHRYDIKGRQIVVKEDFDIDRDRTGRPIPRSERLNRDRRGNSGDRNSSMDRMRSMDSMSNVGSKFGNNTYGLSPHFLESLGISGPLTCKVFVANLDYNVTEKKLKEIFKMAGRITNIELKVDKDGKSKGHGTIEYEHPVEAVQAISMLNGQILFDRKMSVRMDKYSDKDDGGGSMPSKLPSGLKGIGMGLGAGGQPIANFSSVGSSSMSSSLPSNMGSSMNMLANPMGMAGADMGVATAQMGGLGAGMGLGSAMGMNAGGGSGMASLGLAMNSGLGMGNTPLGSGLMGASGGAGNLGGAGGLSSLSSSLAGLIANSGGGGGLGSNVGSLDGGGFGGGGNSGLGSGLGRNDFDYMEREYRSSNDLYSSRNNQRLSDTVCIRNLPSNFTWQTLRERFRDVGDVKYAEMRSKGIGLLRFPTERDAERAMSLMDGARVDGRIIEAYLQ